MEDHANGVTLAGIELAHAVIELHLIVAADAFHGATIDGEDGRVPLVQRQDHGAGLHPGSLLGHHELAAVEVFARLIEQDRDLDRKHMLAIEIAMQTVVVLRRLFEK